MCMRTLYHFPRTILSYKTLMTQYPVHQSSSNGINPASTFDELLIDWLPSTVHQMESMKSGDLMTLGCPSMSINRSCVHEKNMSANFGIWWILMNWCYVHGSPSKVHQKCYLGWCHLMNFDEKGLVRIESRGHERRVPRTCFFFIKVESRGH